MNVGFCALCQKEKNLCRSHLIPKGLYKYVENDDKEGILRFYNGKATKPPGKGHITTPLLCKECEDHFSRAEKLVISEARQSAEKFPLREKLAKTEHRHPINNSSDDFFVFPDECLDINWNMYTFFALSVFWRFSVNKNFPFDESYYNSFGPYQEEIRKILLANNKLSLPDHMYLCIQVNRSDATPEIELTAPSVKNYSGYDVFQFLIPDTLFTLYVGMNINQSVLKLKKRYGSYSILVFNIAKTQYGINLREHVEKSFHEHDREYFTKRGARPLALSKIT